MATLNNQQKQLLFDYYIGLTSEEQATEARELISSNTEASEIYSVLEGALAPLETLEAESCPDELAESTILRLKNTARSSRLQLQQLLAAEQAEGDGVKGRWRNLGHRLAAAAVFIIVGSVLIATYNSLSNYARQKSWQSQCQMQLSRIWQGIENYSSDHDGKLPTVATAAGAPWWKVGSSSKENQSNTRHVWLLVRGDYANAVDFICPGRVQGQMVRFNTSKIQKCSDFPDRRYVNYSFRITNNKSMSKALPGRKALMADLNPLFEKLPLNYSKPLRVKVNEDLLTRNSVNHRRKGQNVLFWDGSCDFVKTRCIGTEADDIFTLQNTDIYQGSEVPSCESDTFLAP